MRFLHIADVHLGMLPDRGHPWAEERQKELVECFYSVLDAAMEQSVELILICGDLFHRQPLRRELKELDYYFRKLSPIRIVMIAGNHDYLKDGIGYRNFTFSDNVTLIDSSRISYVYLEDIHTCVYGASYEHYEIPEAHYQGIRPMRAGIHDDQKLPEDCTHIFMGHGGDATHVPIDFPELGKAGFDYVALGHIHQPRLFTGGQMAYCGALEPLDRTDEGRRGYIIGECHDHQVNIKFVPVDTWNYVNLELTVEPWMSWREILDRINEQLLMRRERQLFKVVLKGKKDWELEYDCEEIEQLGPVVSVEDQMISDFNVEEIYEANAGNILGRYIEKVREQGMEDSMAALVLHYGLAALYQTREG